MENESNKKTAVDFIFSQLPDQYTTTRQGFEVYTQAKEMEKEQIMDAILAGYRDGILKWIGEKWVYESPEQYYAETYGKTFLDLVSDEESKVHEVVRKLKERGKK